MHADCGRSEWVVGWEDEGAPILTAMVGSVFGTGDYVVPSDRYISIFDSAADPLLR